MSVEIRRAADRFVTRRPGMESWHSFSFSHHYDPENIRFGPLLAFNDERLEPGHGYDEHEHQGIRIATYIVSGTLEHTGGGSSTRQLSPGTVEWTDATTGIRHAERAGKEPVRFLQSWLAPDSDANLAITHLSSGESLTTRAPLTHLFVVSGTIEIASETLEASDAARITGSVEATASAPAQLAIWHLTEST